MAKFLTSANSTLTLAISGIFSAPQRIQGYSTNAAFAFDAFAPVEAVMGVDGKKSSGFTPMLKPQRITLQADSKSNDLFDQWYETMNANREDFVAVGTLLIPSIGKKWNMINGSLTNYTPVAEAQKILQPRTFTITWEDVLPSVI